MYIYIKIRSQNQDVLEKILNKKIKKHIFFLHKSFGCFT